ncbi:MAG: hypothetical protein U5K77_00120 [Candidatus Saccharibacteria bacterium]|nr:hypothetical protein [Candidatus Saccharibacteria bacterium]
MPLAKNEAALRKIATLTILVSFLFGFLALVLFWNQPPDKGVPVTAGLSVAATLLMFGAVPFYLSALKSFRTTIKKAYVVFCVGVILFAIAQIQIPIATVFNFWLIVNSGAFMIPYVLAALFMYFGARRIAKILKLQTVLNSPTLIILTATALAGLSYFLPHNPDNWLDTASIKLSVGLVVWVSSNALATALLFFKITEKISDSYKPAMKWLYRSMIMIALTGVHYVFVLLVFVTSRYENVGQPNEIYVPGDWYPDFSLAIIPLIITGLLLIRAGYEFSLLTASKAPADKPTVSDKGLSLLDVITYTSKLATDPADIDPILDPVREITAQMNHTRELSKTEQSTLVRVYLDIERYLIEHEPVRQFDRQSLRETIAEEFSVDPSLKSVLES